MAYGAHLVPGFVGVVPLPQRLVRRDGGWQRGAAATGFRAVPVVMTTTSTRRASSLASGVLLAAAVGVLSVTPASAAMLDDGQAIFEKSCAACHAGGGNIIGFSRGKTLKADKLAKYGFTTPESIAGLVRSGKGVMPGYDVGQLSDADVTAVSNFVLTAAERGWK